MGWLLIVSGVALFFIVRQVLVPVLDELRGLRRDFDALRGGGGHGAHDEPTLLARLERLSAQLDEQNALQRYPFLITAFPLTAIAEQREKCVWIRRKYDQRLDTDTETDDAFTFSHLKLHLMLQANQRVATGLETVQEARRRVSDCIQQMTGGVGGSEYEENRFPSAFREFSFLLLLKTPDGMVNELLRHGPFASGDESSARTPGNQTDGPESEVEV